MNVTTIGLDIAKNVFQIHGVDRCSKPVLRKQLKRAQMLAFFANLPVCQIGLEACAGAHYWARELIKLGHDARLISPQFVKPYVKGNKNDANDAEVICEAVGRPNRRFVPVKSVEQQDMLMWHRIRQGLVKRTHRAGQSDTGLVGRVRDCHRPGFEPGAPAAPGDFGGCRESAEQLRPRVVCRVVPAHPGPGSAGEGV